MTHLGRSLQVIKPLVSVLCPTFGRTLVLPELINSFVNQDYTKSELIILNDRSDQTITCFSDRVKIINTSTRFSNLGDKRNFLVNEASGSHVMMWDDDDIYMPGHISSLVAAFDKTVMPETAKARLHNHMWEMREDKSLFIRSTNSCTTLLIEKQAVIDVHGYRPMPRLQDVDLANKLLSVGYYPFILSGIKAAAAPTTIYRRFGTPYMHVTDFNDDFGAHIGFADNSAQYAEPVGEITIIPVWNMDYVELVRKSWTEYVNQYKVG